MAGCSGWDAAQHSTATRMAGPGAQTAQLVTHLLQQTTATLALLESLRVISPDDAQAIKGRLPNAYGPFQSLEPVPALPARGVADKQPAAANAVEIRAPEALHARALWDYGANVRRRGADGVRS